ncbi:hypothetical protein SS322685_5375 [Shigella sonnei 3226-85]|nr:hypothetical protein SS53G_5113 [Shigella sonnei 53G]EIQ35598.1 hypothetical protein SS322685_5375 [Shigella sonnei 3226-85]EIQ38676.1 hypothetical protein SS323385_4878 [Shigella sonnei 3233-85]EIQ49656.1 hypothetical protein SS482266_4667 [Shigella sonnei 4822-66]EJL10576.1 hypothetical protein SSMOSELEY_5395 [Shigella sonnei str. Moseley]
MLWICKFCRPDKEFTPHPASTKRTLLSGYQAKAGDAANLLI